MTSTTETSTFGQTNKRITPGMPRDQTNLLSNYPKELTQKFQPLLCALCDTKFSSNKTAFMHYNSKNHKRKVNNFLEQWSQETGEPMPKKLCIEQDDLEVKLHCEACDLTLTSKQHAQQHYMGKLHQKVVAGKREPKGFGYYDEQGVWVRMDAKPDKTGRFGIGSGFLKQSDSKPSDFSKLNDLVTKPIPLPKSLQLTEKRITKQALPDLLPPVADVSRGRDTLNNNSTSSKNPNGKNVRFAFYTESFPKTEDTTAASNNGVVSSKIDDDVKATVSLHCELCDINVTSRPQMESHMAGSKHIKKLKQAGLVKPAVVTGTVKAIASNKRNELIYDSNLDVSMFRTPTGSFYCKPCNLSVTNEFQFRSHVTSKNHKRKKNNFM